MKKVSVKRTREFHPHHILLTASYTNFELAEKKVEGWFYFEMATILFAGLAIEAICNSFGERYVQNWDDFESSSPNAKLQIVSNAMGIQYDMNSDPWQHARWVIKFRNKIAHAKPEMIKVNKIMSYKEWENERRRVPESKIERKITHTNAKRSVECADMILKLFCERIPSYDYSTLQADGWQSTASAVESEG